MGRHRSVLIVGLCLAVVLSGCRLATAGSSAQARASAPPAASAGGPGPSTEPHTDPYPANPMGEWDGVLVVEATGGDAGEALSVQEAVVRAGGGEPLLVRGALFVDDAYGEVWLCERVDRDLDAPGARCGGAILLLENASAGAGMLASEYLEALIADAVGIGELQLNGNVRWTAQATFQGRVR